jgi:hypothetical protein
LLSFGFGMSPKAHVSNLWHYWGGETSGVGHCGRSSGHWSCAFEETVGACPSSSSPVCSQPRGEQLCPTMCSCHDVLPHHRPKSKGANQPWAEASKTMSRNKPPLSALVCLSQVQFIRVMESWMAHRWHPVKSKENTDIKIRPNEDENPNASPDDFLTDQEPQIQTNDSPKWHTAFRVQSLTF